MNHEVQRLRIDAQLAAQVAEGAFRFWHRCEKCQAKRAFASLLLAKKREHKARVAFEQAKD